MKLASCDFCPKTKAKPRGDCLSTTIDGKTFDICPPCKESRDAQLKGKGVAASDPFREHGTVRINYPPNTTLLSSTAAGSSRSYGIRPPSFIGDDAKGPGN